MRRIEAFEAEFERGVCGKSEHSGSLRQRAHHRGAIGQDAVGKQDYLVVRGNLASQPQDRIDDIEAQPRPLGIALRQPEIWPDTAS